MIRSLEFLEIVVGDFDRALDWYTRVLGFQLVGEATTNEDGRWCQLKTTAGDKHLALWHSSKNPIPDKCLNPSFIPVFRVDNLHTLVAQLKTNGVVILEDIRERVGYRITSIEDLEGNKLQLLEVTT